MERKANVGWKRFAWMVGITAMVYYAFRYLLPLVWPFIFALLAAGILRPAVRFMSERLRFSVTIAGLLCTAALVLLLGVVGYWGGRLLITQAAQLVANLDTYLAQLETGVERVCHMVEESLSLEHGIVMRTVMDGVNHMSSEMGKGLFAGVRDHTWDVIRFVAKLVTVLLVFLIATVLMLKEMLDTSANETEGSSFAGRWRSLREKLSQIGLAYLKTQGILILIIAGILTVGLMFLRNRYALLIGIGVGFMDALPVLGSGMILVPWGVLSFFFGSRMQGIIILALFLICQVTRELLEPRLLGDRIGIRPIYTLVAMYVGLKLFGIAGFLLGPVGLVLIQALVDEVPEEWK